MRLKIRNLFFPYWFPVLLAGGLAGFLFSFIGRTWGIALGVGVGWVAGLCTGWLSRRRQAQFLRALAENDNATPAFRDAAAEGVKSDQPLESALRTFLEKSSIAKVQEIISANPAEQSHQGLVDSLNEFIQEEERMAQTFHSFRETIRDWSSNIEKAGRINKSLLQLNELIVNDS